MHRFKRKRCETRECDKWDLFVIKIQAQILQPNYNHIIDFTVLPMKIKLTMAIGSRVCPYMLHTLCGDTYRTEQRVEVCTEQKILTIHIQFATHAKRRSDNSLRLLVGTDRGELDQPNPPPKQCTPGLEFHIAELQEKLHLQNQEIYSNLRQVIQEVHTAYWEEMDWTNSSSAGATPYEIIYHKKHKHIITRFKFTADAPNVQLLGFMPSLMSTPWIEYDQPHKTFWLVAVLEECV